MSHADLSAHVPQCRYTTLLLQGISDAEDPDEEALSDAVSKGVCIHLRVWVWVDARVLACFRSLLGRDK